MKTNVMVNWELNPIAIVSLDEHWLESDEERDYTVDYLRSSGERVVGCISKEEYLKLCEVKIEKSI